MALSEYYYYKAEPYAASIYIGAPSSCSSLEEKAKEVKKEHRWL
jgi:hypothetical protein